MATAAFLLTACSTDLQQASELMADDGSIQFEATVTASVTRAATTGGMSPQHVSGYKSDLWLIPSVTDMETATTRGTQLNSESALASFGVSAYKHAKGVDITNAKPDYFYNKKVTKDDVTLKYGFEQDYYWPSGSEYLTFYAYYPYNSGASAADDNTLVSLSPSTQEGPQVVTLTVSEDATRQIDFMTAIAANQTPATGGPAVGLQFRHQLCGIRFKIGDQFPTKGYIQKITLTNVYKKGKYTIGAGTNPWELDEDDRGDFEVGYTADRAVTAKGSDITADNEVFLMIPYTFPAEDPATVKIDFWAGDQTYTVTSSLAGHVWEAGKTVTYELSSENLTTLKISTLDYYQYADATVNSSMPVKAWANDDQVGMYVVQGTDANGESDGRTLRYANVPCTYNGTTGKWEIAEVNDKPVFKYPGDSYYFYYPYQEGGPVGYPNECNAVGASAETFFSSVISAHAVKADQSTPANFKASDLQVSKAVTPEEDADLPASTIKATMARQVGLAVISLGTDQANKTKVFTNNNAGEVTETASVTASDTFSGNIPYNNSSAYYAYVKAGTATTFSSAVYSDTNKDAWAGSLVFTVAAGSSASQTAHSARKNWDYINAVWNYSYTANNCYTWTAPLDASYTMECWGAQGGKGVSGGILTDAGGKGAYVKGVIDIPVSQTLYVYVGGKGGEAAVGSLATRGYNGGGTGDHDHADDEACGGGGGATDIRLTNGTWDTFSSLKSRIMVAAGGGGGETLENYGEFGGTQGGEGAALSGGASYKRGISLESYGTLSSQTGGYKFGIGQDGVFISENHPRGGGGGGYYGGVTPRDNEYDGFYGSPGFGGSSFISGHAGCNAIAESSTSNNITHTGSPNHYSGLVFTNTQMIDGRGTQTKPAGGTETGHSGDGYARITLTRW